MISTSVGGVRESVRINTTNKSASAEIAEATSGVNAREKPRTNFATASSGAGAANGKIEGRRKHFNLGKRAAAKVATLPLLQSSPESNHRPKSSTRTY